MRQFQERLHSDLYPYIFWNSQKQERQSAFNPNKCSQGTFDIFYNRVFDAVHLINICTKTGEPSHIQELRDYANELEKELEAAMA